MFLATKINKHYYSNRLVLSEFKIFNFIANFMKTNEKKNAEP